MRTVPTSGFSLRTGDQPPITAPSPSWRDTLTVIRMGLAFLFPWPFGTKGLKAAVATRALRLRAPSPRPVPHPGTPET
jgi:hypothetical protein